ncbi:HlyD family type I secretion periplasmic adaptor subunit, partial [Pseudomonas aeruginosa]|nr:HlyD family type I secretion periplasmic adaptor subunit [Pseudomonas aeruginosa]
VRAEELRNRLASARFDLANSEVRAPVAGLVVGQEVFTEGGVIAPGQQLMEILPERQPLLVDARLPVEMVDKVRVGLPVELMFSAFSQSTTPRVEGEVTLVSADRLLDERSEAPYYRVRIRVGEEGVRRLAGLEIRPGMPVEAFVRSGERSLLNYLFKPLADRTHLALGEE